MQVRNNEIWVQRGETFTMSKLIQNRDGSPFIVSSEFENPYWLITVSSNAYDQSDRYILNKWLELKNSLRFRITQPVKLRDYGLTFADEELPFMDIDSDGENDFTGDETSGYSNIAIFYEIDSAGVTHYKYWEYINNIEGNYEGRWADYKCQIITAFNNDVTSQWVEQEYIYQINLVDGLSTLDYLLEEAYILGIDVDLSDPLLIQTLYESVSSISPDSVKNVDVNAPLMALDVNVPILSPTKLYVKIDLNGGR